MTNGASRRRLQSKPSNVSRQGIPSPGIGASYAASVRDYLVSARTFDQKRVRGRHFTCDHCHRMKIESSQANHGVLRTIFYRLQHFSDGVSECFYTTVHYADTKG